jgi:hypothetical protein
MLVCVSCIQNTQIRGKTTAKVLGKVDTFWTYHHAIKKNLTSVKRNLSFTAFMAYPACQGYEYLAS